MKKQIEIEIVARTHVDVDNSAIYMKKEEVVKDDYGNEFTRFNKVRVIPSNLTMEKEDIQKGIVVGQARMAEIDDILESIANAEDKK